ncbi:uncharacterized protein LOC143526804 [Brachyhypopomus gauderio]|uniref:uncharacterized protein LOC143526804 n=1 Tax=Brachyhypopomus gauderio TaxID=698409 RepID=UPI00404121EA
MERTGLGRCMQKPPVPPKPKVIPPPKHTQHPAVAKPALNPEVSRPQKHVVRPVIAAKPSVSALVLKFKLLTSRGEHHAHFQSRNPWQVNLLNNRNGHLPEQNKPEQDHIVPMCVCVKGKCCDCSAKDNSKRLAHNGKCAKTYIGSKAEDSRNPAVQTSSKQQAALGFQGQVVEPSVQNSAGASPGLSVVIPDESPVKVNHYENVPIANGSVGNERHVRIKRQNSAIATHVPSLVVTGTSSKSLEVAMKESEPTGGVVETQHDGGRLPTVYPVWRPVLSKRGQVQDIHLPGPSQNTGRKECLNVQDHCKKERSVDDDDEPDGETHIYQHPMPVSLAKLPKPNCIAANANQAHHQSKGGVPTATTLGVKPCKEKVSHIGKLQSNDTTDKKPRTKMKAEGRSLSPADINQPNSQRMTTSQKIMAFDLPTKKLPKPDCNTVEGEQSVEEAWRAVGSKNGTCSQVSLYRSHEFKVQGKELLYKQAFSISLPANEQCVDEETVDEETILVEVRDTSKDDDHIYEDIREYVNEPALGSEYLIIEEPVTNQQAHTSNTEKDVYEKPDASDEFANTSMYQNCSERNVYEDVESSDDTLSEWETFDSSEEEEEHNSLDTSKGVYQNDVRSTKLFHIAEEIMTSEKVFVNVLKLLNITFRDSVAKASSQMGKPVIEERVLNQILSSLPQLYKLNCDLLHELEDRMAHWNENAGVADIFLKKGPYLKMYTSYICEFDKNVALLEEQCRKNPAFAKVVREFESSPCCANLAVKHYMLKPVQRLPQYQLLLSDYLKNLNENSPDYRDTQAALNIVKEVANHANETMKQGDNFQKLIQVQYRLTGQHEIVQPGRVLLKEGILMKLSRKVMQPGMFFLFNDVLLYTTPLQSGQYKLINELSLAGMKVTKPSQEGYQNELNIESVERSFILSCSSPANRDEWLEAISAAIDDFTKKQISFNTSKSPEEGDIQGHVSKLQLGTKAPIWIPDLRTSMCMICTCVFTLTWRRHHCRACGKVVCQSCSSNKHPLEYLKNQPARVCDQCLEILQQNSSGNQTPGAILSPNAKLSSAFTIRRQKKIPAALKEVAANTDKPSMSGYMERMKANRKPWKRLWFVIKNKVLYTYAASEDVVALESLPLLGFSLREEESSSVQFWLYHKDVLFYTFKTDDSNSYHRWVEAFRDAMVL